MAALHPVLLWRYDLVFRFPWTSFAEVVLFRTRDYICLQYDHVVVSNIVPNLD